MIGEYDNIATEFPEQDEDDLNLNLDTINEVNENPTYKMPPPNDDCGCVNGLESVVYGPPDVREQISKVLKEHGLCSEQWKKFREENPWYGVHINGRPDIAHFQYIWNAHLVEDILYDNEDIIKAVYRLAIKEFKEQAKVRLKEKIKQVLIEDEDNINKVKVHEDILSVSVAECKQSLTKALSFIINWLCACYCFEEAFWIGRLQLIDSVSVKNTARKKMRFKFRHNTKRESKQKNRQVNDEQELTAYERMRQQKREQEQLRKEEEREVDIFS